MTKSLQFAVAWPTSFPSKKLLASGLASAGGLLGQAVSALCRAMGDCHSRHIRALDDPSLVPQPWQQR